MDKGNLIHYCSIAIKEEDVGAEQGEQPRLKLSH